MKKTSLLTFLVIAPLLAGCNNGGGGGKNKNNNNGGSNGSESFKDSQIQKEINVKESVKDTKRSEIKSYRSDVRMITDSAIVKSLDPSQYYSTCIQTDITESYYFSRETQTFTFETFSPVKMSASIKKEGDRYIGGGYYEDLNVDENQDYFKRVYEYYSGDMIYSFGLIDSLRNLYSSDMKLSLDGNQATFGAKIEDEQWYEKIVCTNYESAGNLSVGISSPISASFKFSMMDFTFDVTETFSYVDFKYKNYLSEYQLCGVNLGYKGDIPVEDVDNVLLQTFEYNV